MKSIVVAGALAVAVLVGGCAKTTSELDGVEARDPMMRSALAKEREGDKDGAILALSRALEHNSDMALGHLRIALLYDEHAKDFRRAVYHYQRYLELRPDTEKKDMIVDRIKDAEVLLCAGMSGRTLPIETDSSALKEENIVLKRENQQLRANLSEMSAVAGANAAAVAEAPRRIVEERAETLAPAPMLAPEPVKAVESAEVKGRVYVVERYDTLSGIAARMYENPREWKRILNANSAALGGDPTKLKVGQKLIIPD